MRRNNPKRHPPFNSTHSTYPYPPQQNGKKNRRTQGEISKLSVERARQEMHRVFEQQPSTRSTYAQPLGQYDTTLAVRNTSVQNPAMVNQTTYSSQSAPSTHWQGAFPNASPSQANPSQANPFPPKGRSLFQANGISPFQTNDLQAGAQNMPPMQQSTSPFQAVPSMQQGTDSCQANPFQTHGYQAVAQNVPRMQEPSCPAQNMPQMHDQARHSQSPAPTAHLMQDPSIQAYPQVSVSLQDQAGPFQSHTLDLLLTQQQASHVEYPAQTTPATQGSVGPAQDQTVEQTASDLPSTLAENTGDFTFTYKISEHLPRHQYQEGQTDLPRFRFMIAILQLMPPEARDNLRNCIIDWMMLDKLDESTMTQIPAHDHKMRKREAAKKAMSLCCLYAEDPNRYLYQSKSDHSTYSTAASGKH